MVNTTGSRLIATHRTPSPARRMPPSTRWVTDSPWLPHWSPFCQRLTCLPSGGDSYSRRDHRKVAGTKDLPVSRSDAHAAEVNEVVMHPSGTLHGQLQRGLGRAARRAA